MAAAALTVPEGCPLTVRQLELLRLAMDGDTYAEIGRRLHLSASGVRQHLHNAYKRLGVSGRAGAMAYMAQRGWWGDWKLPAAVEEQEAALVDVNPWLPAYLAAFDRFVASGLRDGRARTGMRVALWGVQNGG